MKKALKHNCDHGEIMDESLVKNNPIHQILLWICSGQNGSLNTDKLQFPTDLNMIPSSKYRIGLCIIEQEQFH